MEFFSFNMNELHIAKCLALAVREEWKEGGLTERKRERERRNIFRNFDISPKISIECIGVLLSALCNKMR